MTPSDTRVIAAAFLTGFSAAACATTTGGATHPVARPTATTDAGIPVAARARGDSARYPYTAADVHFMTAMIGHHSQAIAMARRALTHGASPSVRILAERIANGQRDEIATMQQWLRDRQRTVPDSGGLKMTMDGQEHVMPMPGMITDAQMNQLDRSRGMEFDRLFLTFMIRHHRGAVSMVKDLFASYGAAQDETVFKFASDVNVDQVTEIERMEKMLLDLMVMRPSP